MFSPDDPVIYFGEDGEARNRKISNENFIDPHGGNHPKDSVRIRKISDEIKARMGQVRTVTTTGQHTLSICTCQFLYNH